MRATPSSVEEIIEIALVGMKGKFRPIYLFIFAGAMWALWKTRNDLVFEDKVIASPVMIVHRMMVLLTYWKMLLDEKKKLHVDEVLVVINKSCDLII